MKERGISNLIRGDEAFGWLPVIDDQDVRVATRIPHVNDFNLPSELKKWELLKQQYYPKWLKKKQGESLESWRDRIYLTYDLPCVLAALSQIKSDFGKTINPFLNDRIIEVVKSLPDNLRTDKALFNEIVGEWCPDIPYATSSSNPKLKEYLINPYVSKYLNNRLKKGKAYGIIPENIVDYFLVENIEIQESFNIKNRLKKISKKYFPTFLKKHAKKLRGKESINYYQFKFRLFLILEMYSLLKRDAQMKEKKTN